MRKWLGRIGLIFTLPALIVVAGLCWFGFHYLTYGPIDDPEKLEKKAAYLAQIERTRTTRPRDERPNVIIVFYDDLGFGDLGFTGSRAIKTPNIDALASDGFVLQNFHSASPVCSPSRAGLLTGRLPPRAGLPNVIFPSGSLLGLSNVISGDNSRLPAEEITLADILRADGYRTGMVGKWHMGDEAPSLPNNMGFDHFYGALYSNDMEPFAIYRNAKIAVPAPADQTKMDGLYTREAVRFIRERNEDGAPFFLYFAHNFPHLPLYADPQREGTSQAGLYGDVVEGLDDGIGAITAALRETGQLDNTIIVITSDNGPWYEGSPGFNRGRKGQTFGGGMHVPFVLHWPAKIPTGQRSPEMAMATDLVPTMLDWLEIAAPTDRVIDGRSLRPLFEGTDDSSRHYYYFYSGDQLLAVRSGRFKYHARQPVIYAVSGMKMAPGEDQGPWLFDLSLDPDESYNVAMKYPDIARQLKQKLEARQAEDARNLRGWK